MISSVNCVIYKQFDFHRCRVDGINEIISSVFDYYCDAVMFNSKTSWSDITNYHSNFFSHKCDDYIHNGFTDILLHYFDSGDFSVSFDLEKYTPKIIGESIRAIVNNCICE